MLLLTFNVLAVVPWIFLIFSIPNSTASVFGE
jgi:hypothetical protein